MAFLAYHTVGTSCAGLSCLFTKIRHNYDDHFRPRWNNEPKRCGRLWRVLSPPPLWMALKEASRGVSVVPLRTTETPLEASLDDSLPKLKSILPNIINDPGSRVVQLTEVWERSRTFFLCEMISVRWKGRSPLRSRSLAGLWRRCHQVLWSLLISMSLSSFYLYLLSINVLYNGGTIYLAFPRCYRFPCAGGSMQHFRSLSVGADFNWRSGYVVFPTLVSGSRACGRLLFSSSSLQVVSKIDEGCLGWLLIQLEGCPRGCAFVPWDACQQRQGGGKS